MFSDRSPWSVLPSLVLFSAYYPARQYHPPAGHRKCTSHFHLETGPPRGSGRNLPLPLEDRLGHHLDSTGVLQHWGPRSSARRSPLRCQDDALDRPHARPGPGAHSPCAAVAGEFFPGLPDGLEPGPGPSRRRSLPISHRGPCGRPRRKYRGCTSAALSHGSGRFDFELRYRSAGSALPAERFVTVSIAPSHDGGALLFFRPCPWRTVPLSQNGVFTRLRYGEFDYFLRRPQNLFLILIRCYISRAKVFNR